LKEKQREILKIINEATNRIDLNKFAETTELTPSEAIANIQALTNEGFLRKVDTGYGLTEKGKNTCKAFVEISQEKAFQFYTDVDKPLGVSANSIGGFYHQIKQVSLETLDFHLYRDDFENWLRQVVGSVELVEEVIKFKEQDLCGEKIRRALLKTIDAHYAIEDS